MHARFPRVLAVIISVLVVSATVGAAAYADLPSNSVPEEPTQEPRAGGNNGNGNNGNGNGTGNGPGGGAGTGGNGSSSPGGSGANGSTPTNSSNSTPTGSTNTTSSTPGGASNSNSTNRGTKGGPKNGTAKNKSASGNKGASGKHGEDPAKNRSGNRGNGGPPADRGTQNGGGPPSWAGPGSERGPEEKGAPGDRGNSGDRGPPDWVTNRSSNETAISDGVVVTPANGTALAYRAAAFDALETASLTPGRGGAGKRAALRKALRRTFGHFYDADRVNDVAVLDADHRVIAATQRHAPNISSTLVAADRKLALQAVQDLERTRRILADRNATWNTTLVNASITNATDAIERGDRKRDAGQPAAASAAYRTAWGDAQLGLDHLDESVTPVVTLENRSDLPRPENVTYPFTGTVFAVRSHELDAVTVTQNNRSWSTPLPTNTTPATTHAFATNLTLGPGVYRVTANATDPNDRYAPGDILGETVRDDDYDTLEPVNGTGLARYDGDGLPDIYELDVTGTRPLDPDSNASTTVYNESADGIVDGLTDLDGDTAATFHEFEAGTDPLAPDTDSDTLSDGVELRLIQVDPLLNDTDSDGVRDAQEDFDNDTLPTGVEIRNGSHPLYPDTDADDLRDADELENSTDPVNPDTDGDGLLDGEELRLQTDPTLADTDGDGVQDGNETLQSETRNESAGITLDIAGKGDVASTVTVRNVSAETLTGGSADAAVTGALDFQTERTFENATITFDYEEDRLDGARESALGVYRYDPKRQTFVPLQSSVNASANTVSAETPHFSTYTVLDSDRWGGYHPTTATPEQHVDEEFHDLGGWTCSTTCEATGGVAVGGHAPPGSDGTAGTESLSGFAAFDGGGGFSVLAVIADPPGDGGDITTTTTTTTTSSSGGGGGGTTIPDDGTGGEDPREVIPPTELEGSFEIPEDAVTATLEVSLVVNSENANSPVQVAARSPSHTYHLYDQAGTKDDPIHRTVTRSVDLSGEAGEVVGVQIRSLNTSGFHVRYVRIHIERDSDGDGLTNRMEADVGFRDGRDNVIHTNPYSADTDGDGLIDGYEIRHRVDDHTSLKGGYFLLNSDPTATDTDGDGLNDGAELVWDTNPFEIDTDGDGFIDLVDEHPTRENTPPSVQITAADSGIVIKKDYFERVRIKVRDESRLDSLNFTGEYNPYVGSSFWKGSTPELEYVHKEGDSFEYSYVVDVYQHGALSEAPDQYYVNATDVAGSGMSLHVVPQQDFSVDGAEIAAVPVFGGVVVQGGAGGTVGSTVGGAGLTASAFTGGVLIAVVAGGAVIYDQRPAGGYESEYIVGKRHLPVPPTSPDTPFETPAGVEIRLPSGVVYEAPPGHGNGYDRRFGWKEVSRLPGIQSRDDVGYVIRHPAPGFVDSEGPYNTYIGENPHGPDKIIIGILGGSVVWSGKVIKDPQGRRIILDRNNRHPVRCDESHPCSYREVERAINNPKQIWKNGRELHYISYIDGRWLVVRAHFAGEGWTISTAVYYDSKQKIIEYINERELDNRVYGEPIKEMTGEGDDE